MSVHHLRSDQLLRVCMFTVLLLLAGMVVQSSSGTAIDVMNAFYLQQVPPSYGDQERLFASLHDTGANAVMIGLPLTEEGLPDIGKMPNIVYLVHKAGLKAVVVLPVRKLPGVVKLHRDWEDVRYDPARDSSDRAGTLDLFRPEAEFYLVDLVKRLASYSVDGIFFGQDFMYGPGDGMSDWARAKAKERLGEPVRQKKMFLEVTRGPEGSHGKEYSELFWKWAEFKRDRLLQVYDAMASAAKSVNPSLVLGIPAPVVLPVPVSREVLAQYSYDMAAFRQRRVDYYWTHIASTSMKERQNMSYRQAMELVSRTALSSATTVKEVEKQVIVLDATSKDGRLLPLSELEEASELARNSGNGGIAYTVTRDTIVPKAFMHKMFGRKG